MTVVGTFLAPLVLPSCHWHLLVVLGKFAQHQLNPTKSTPYIVFRMNILEDWCSQQGYVCLGVCSL